MSGNPLFPALARWTPKRFISRLKEVGYTAENLGETPPQLRGPVLPREIAAARATLDGRDDPFATAIRLFHLGDGVPLPQAMELLDWQIKDLLDIGVLSQIEGSVRAEVCLKPVGNTWVASDFPSQQSDRPDWVMGVGPSTRQLLHLAPPQLARGRVLEAGCGMAWLSRQLAAGGAEVVATDVNPRALEMARLNGVLSGVENVCLRPGDFFDAADDGGPFDLILSNPPYVLSPGGSQTYRETSTGVSLCQSVVSRAANHLRPGGVAVVLLNWGHQTDEDWRNSPMSWLKEQPVQCWLNQTDCDVPETYAWRWIEHDPRHAGAQAAEAELKRWILHYREQNIRRVSAGYMVIRKPADADEVPWRRADSRHTGLPVPDAGEDVLRLLDNESWLQKHKPAPGSLLERNYQVPAGVHARVWMRLDQSWNRITLELSSPAALSYDGQVDETILRLLEHARNGLPPRTLLEEIQKQKIVPRDVDLASKLSELTRELIRFGLLIP